MTPAGTIFLLGALPVKWSREIVVSILQGHWLFLLCCTSPGCFHEIDEHQKSFLVCRKTMDEVPPPLLAHF